MCAPPPGVTRTLESEAMTRAREDARYDGDADGVTITPPDIAHIRSFMPSVPHHRGVPGFVPIRAVAAPTPTSWNPTDARAASDTTQSAVSYTHLTLPTIYSV